MAANLLDTGVQYGNATIRTSGKWATRAIFGYGTNGSLLSLTNLVNNYGGVSADVTGVSSARYWLAGAGYGIDKALFGYGTTGTVTAITNLISNLGVVAGDTAGVGTARQGLAAAGYGTDKAIYGYGSTGSATAVSNLVSNLGVVATDTTGVGTVRFSLAAAGYGGDKAIFVRGSNYPTVGGFYSLSNLVSNTGVVANDVTGVGTAMAAPSAASYGGDKAIVGYGYSSPISGGVSGITNLISNTGVVATDTTGVGTARGNTAAAGYGGDKAIFGYGTNSFTNFAITNLVSNTGVVAGDSTAVGTGRNLLAAASYSS